MSGACDPCGGPFRVRVLVPMAPAVVRVPVLIEPAVVRVLVPGPMGPQGERGVPGPGLSTLSITQAQPSAFWLLAHNLGRYPSVSLIDTAGDVFGGAVRYLDENTISITLSAPTAGTAHLN